MGYSVSDGYIAVVNGRKMKFATEQEYFEYIKEEGDE